jgi:glycine cleavage system transcriptional repressor
MKELVITAVGPDRPGIVGRLTAPLFEASANVADSRMVNLRGQFALMLLAEVPERCFERVTGELEAVARELGLSLSFARHPDSAERSPTAVGIPYRLRTFAMDQPGIVHRITDLLHRQGINVEELETRSQPRPQSGSPLFSMDVRLTVPPEVSLKKLRLELETLCDTLNCDVELQQAPLAT